MVKYLNKLAREIVRDNQYVIISSVGGGKAWISPVVYAYDNEYNFYFVSMPTSRHCLNIKEDNNVSIAIFDSHQLWGMGVGLQIEANCNEIGLKDLPKAIKTYATRKYPYGGLNTKIAMDFAKSMILKRKLYKMYKITPKVVWMNNPNSDTDVRVQVYL